jgi:hypothetical protein
MGENLQYRNVIESVNRVIEEYVIRLTVRQIYYRLISPPFQIFANTGNNYKQFDKMLTKARERGDVNWRRIEDRARQTLGGDWGYENIDDYLNAQIRRLRNCADYFTMPMWSNQSKIVECWVEKDALAALFESVCNNFRVITFPSRGYSSFTKIMEAIADRFIAKLQRGQQIIILHFSDHDPSGLDMSTDLLTRIREYLPKEVDQHTVEVERFSSERPFFEIIRCALTIDQVRQFSLASNPTKSADPRARDYVAQYGNECWELDALPPDELQNIIRRSIQQYIDTNLWNQRVQDINEAKTSLRERISHMNITFT